MLQEIKNHRAFIAILALIFFIVIPILLNVFVSFNGIPSKMGKDAWLGFWCTNIGSFITVMTLMITISYTRFMAKCDIKKERIEREYNCELDRIRRILDLLLLKKYDESVNGNIFSGYAEIAILGEIRSDLFDIPKNKNDYVAKEKFYDKVELIHSEWLVYTSKFAMDAVSSGGNHDKWEQSFDDWKQRLHSSKNHYSEELRILYNTYANQLKINMDREIDSLYKF